MDSDKFTLHEHKLETVNKYKYLGITFSSSGSWQYAREELYKKGTKAFFKLRKMMGMYTDPEVILHIFDHTIKPILLYGCEVWSTNKEKTACR